MFKNHPQRKRGPPPELEKNKMQEVAADAGVARAPKRQRSNTSVKRLRVPVTEDADYLTYFRPDEYLIFNEAYNMVRRLVVEDGPYRRKLVDLAKCSIEDAKNKKWLKAQITADGLIELAIENVRFAWVDPSVELCSKDEACALTSYCDAKDLRKRLPLIAISSSFMENDYCVGKEGTPDAVTTMEDMTTQLFFMKKIKHELLHVMVKTLPISEKKQFPKEATPDKYTPRKQRRRQIWKPKAEVGDHDEEEDTGGPILPLYYNQKLSAGNPLCVFFEDKYLKLTDDHIRALLQLDLYKEELVEFIKEKSHFLGLWSASYCRACKIGILKAEFFQGETVHRPPVAASAVSNSSASSISSSPAKPHDFVNEFDDSVVGDGVAAWRMQQTPFRVPDSFLLSKLDSAEEWSLTDESVG